VLGGLLGERIPAENFASQDIHKVEALCLFVPVRSFADSGTDVGKEDTH
jgi:hypothetical protein